jgi:Tfp pilus assembly protein PilF
MKAKEYDEAINSYSKAINDDPTEPASFSNRALAYLK